MHTKYTHLYNSTDLTFCVNFNNSVDCITFICYTTNQSFIGRAVFKQNSL